MTFEQMWRDLLPIGRSSVTGGYFRQPFSAAERECTAWFLEQCAARDLEVETDGNGNLVAWWRGGSRATERRVETPTSLVPRSVRQARPASTPRPLARPPLGPPGPASLDAPSPHPNAHPRPAAPGRPPSVVTGSHLDSVLDGGAYDGPLGVVSALAAVDLLRERGFTPAGPIGISVFTEEEGSRFGLACLGSRLLTGALQPEQARELRDRDGTFLLDAMSAAGLEPALGPSPLLDGIDCFVELHVEQGRDLVDRGAAVGVARGIWPHGRYRFDFTGEADHAGTTRMEDRHDPMLTYAMTALAANKQARLSGQRATFGRLAVNPNGTNAVPSRVTAWLDARADTEEHLAELLAGIERLAAERAGRDGTQVTVVAESVSGAVRFDTDAATELSRIGAIRSGGVAGDRWPVIATAAGHDAGVVQASGRRSAMLFVRNPTGVSHSPAEHAELADCLAGVEALAKSLAGIVGGATPDRSLPPDPLDRGGWP